MDTTALSHKYNVYVVIVTYQGSKWIESCIRSVISSNYQVKVIVVDNASSDDTVMRVQAFSNVLCLCQSKNFGFGRANNIGIKKALKEGADFVFLINQDARIEKNTISRLVNFALRHKNYGIISPLHLNGDGTKIDDNFISWIVRDGYKFFSDLYFNCIQNVYTVSFVNAAAWLITRQCLLTVGGFDPLFFMYGEDEDFCNRVSFHGYKIGILPSTVMFHNRENPSSMRTNYWSAVLSRYRRYNSAMLTSLKRTDGTFARRMLGLIGQCARWGLLEMGGGNLKGLIGIFFSYMKILLQAPQVWWHRKRNLSKGAHWIRPADCRTSLKL